MDKKVTWWIIAIVAAVIVLYLLFIRFPNFAPTTGKDPTRLTDNPGPGFYESCNPLRFFNEEECASCCGDEFSRCVGWCDDNFPDGGGAFYDCVYNKCFTHGSGLDGCFDGCESLPPPPAPECIQFTSNCLQANLDDCLQYVTFYPSCFLGCKAHAIEQFEENEFLCDVGLGEQQECEAFNGGAECEEL